MSTTYKPPPMRRAHLLRLLRDCRSHLYAEALHGSGDDHPMIREAFRLVERLDRAIESLTPSTEK